MAFRRFGHLNVPEYWEKYFTRYPQGMTILESLFNWVDQVDKMVDTQNQLSGTVETFGNRLDEFINKFDPKLRDTVISVIMEWQANGLLDIIIDEALQTQMDDLYDSTSTTLEDFRTYIRGVQQSTINYSGTLAELQADSSLNKNKNYVITNPADNDNFGFVFYHNGSTWVKGWAANIQALGEGVVTPENTSFLVAYNATDSNRDAMPFVLSQRGDFYDPSNGILSNNAGTQNFKNTGKIYLTEPSVLKTRGVNSWVFFNKANQFIGKSEHGSDTNLAKYLEIKPPDGTDYVIGNIPKPYWWDNDDPDYPLLTASLDLIPIKQKMQGIRVTSENLEKVTDTSFIPKNINKDFTLSAEGYVIDPTSGVINVQTDRRHSNKRELPDDTLFGTYGVSHVIFYDKDGVFMNQTKSYGSDIAMGTWQFWKKPKGAKLVAFNLFPYYYDRFEFYQMESSEKVFTINNTLSEKKADSSKRFTGEVFAHLGDSIVGNYTYPSDVSTTIANRTGATVHNFGFGGTRAAFHPNEHFNNFSFYKLATAIATGDFSAQRASSLVTGIGMPPNFREKVPLMESLDWSKVSIIPLNIGTNDWNGVVPIDNPLDKYDTNSILGAIRFGIRAINRVYPQIKFIIGTPIYRFKEDGSQDSDDWLAGTNKLTDIVDALPSISKDVKYPVVDCYYSLGINKENRLYYFHKADGTHPLDTGRKEIGNKMADGILSNF